MSMFSVLVPEVDYTPCSDTDMVVECFTQWITHSSTVRDFKHRSVTAVLRIAQPSLTALICKVDNRLDVSNSKWTWCPPAALLCLIHSVHTHYHISVSAVLRIIHDTNKTCWWFCGM